MSEGAPAQPVAVNVFASDAVAAGEAAPSDDVDRARIVPEGQVHRCSAPHAGDHPSGEHSAAQVDAVVIAPAHPKLGYQGSPQLNATQLTGSTTPTTSTPPIKETSAGA